MSSLPENIDALKHTGAEFLIADLDTALAFMDVADTSGDKETVARNHRNAGKAYNTVLDFLSKLALMPSDREAVESKLAVLKARTEAWVYRFKAFRPAPVFTSGLAGC
jgi:hypothetical protein